MDESNNIVTICPLPRYYWLLICCMVAHDKFFTSHRPRINQPTECREDAC